MTNPDPVESIDVPVFFVADHAEAVRGKLYVTGGCWNVLTVGRTPARHGHLSLAMAIRVPWHETNIEHDISVDMLDEDGLTVLPEPVAGKFEVGRAPGVRPGDEVMNVMVLNLESIEFPKSGVYQFVLSINGDIKTRASFRVREAIPQAATT